MQRHAVTIDRSDSGYRFGAFVLDTDRAAVLKDGVPVRLRCQSFDVLQYLVERAGRLVQKEELLAAIWGKTVVTDDSLTHCLIDIRKVLGDTQHELIQTVPRRGFIFDMPVRRLRKRRRQSLATMAIAACLMVIIIFMPAISKRFTNPANRIESRVLVNAEALGLLRQARFVFNRRAPGDMPIARQYYLQATATEPEYADAWAGIAATHYIEFLANRANTGKLGLIRQFAEKAIAIDPDNAEGHFRLANYYFLVGDEEAADRHIQHAFAERPDDPLILGVMAGRHARRGDIDRAIALSYEAVAIDPLSVLPRGNLSSYLLAGGRYEEAIEQSTRASILAPHVAHGIQLVAGLALIKLARYQDALEMALAWPHTAERYEVMAMAHFGVGRDSEAIKAASQLKTFVQADDLLRLAELQAYCDEIELSFQTLDIMRERLSGDLLFDEIGQQIQDVELSPFMANVRADGRWAEWLQETQQMTDVKLVLSLR